MTTIVSKERIKREYEAIRVHESVKDAIHWTAHKLNVTEQEVAEVVYENAPSLMIAKTIMGHNAMFSHTESTIYRKAG